MSLEHKDILIEVDWDNDDSFSHAMSEVDDWLSVKYRIGNAWQNGWPEPESARGELLFKNQDRRWQNLDLIQRESAHKMRVSVDGKDLFSGRLQSMNPTRDSKAIHRVKGRIESPNKDKFNRTIEYANVDPIDTFEVLVGYLERARLPQGSIVLGRQQAGVFSEAITVKQFLSQFSRFAGAFVGEDRHSNIGCIHWGLASQHQGPMLDVEDVFTSERPSLTFKRDLRTEVEITVTRAVETTSHPLSDVDVMVDAGETVIIRAEATGDTLIDANWDDPEPYLGVSTRVIEKQPKTLVLEITNVTDTIIPYQLSFSGAATYARNEDTLIVRSPLADEIDRRRLVLPTWFAQDQLAYGEHTFDYYREGINWGSFKIIIDQVSDIPLEIQPGVVFGLENADILNPPTNQWLCYAADFDLSTDKLSSVTIEAIGLHDPREGSRWGRALWNEGRWVASA